ncbi:uncharacterized protein B0P05DRAFT_585799 [Gilbertella persicaria]|uniref:uncharacterized protein n=1 Tax=Gilbertella persicaria TaxID=101096 RepID=UPI002220D357|nr:uncharacterized protein B0P05DRAFT_585799 [Gilbertella persicaria]KAI8084026.1 hypothetical protein B0P05DRAFT_585799 [Gilbertella persicaria]
MSTHSHLHRHKQDISKHLESLQARLEFARFKLRNGWQTNTFGDVEYFWKQRQRQTIKEIPVPRFTQQDIIERKTCQLAKRGRPSKANSALNRSTPSLSINKKQHAIKKQQFASQHESIHQPTYHFHHYDQENWNTDKPGRLTRNYSVSSFDESRVPSDPDDEPSIVNNSLDYLSYAIAMKEHQRERQNSEQMIEEPTLLEDDEDEDEDTDHNLRDDVSPDWTRTSRLRLSLSIPNQPYSQHKSPDVSNTSSPLSATNAAAEAMLMFVHTEKNQQD